MSSLKIVIAFVCGFLVAQLAKTILAVCTGKKNIKKYLTKSGGLPSGHAASFSAASMCIGFYEGFDSAVFMLAMCVMMIVLYDAVNVRRAVGEQGKALNKIIESPLRVVEGHKLYEVCAGILIGVLVGVVIWNFF